MCSGMSLSLPSPSPPRLWRLRAGIYDRTMPRLAEKVSGLANGLNEFDGPEFKDYSSSYFLDEAAATPLLDNAKNIADKMLGPESRDRVFKELLSGDGPPAIQTVNAAIDTAFRKVLGRAPKRAHLGVEDWRKYSCRSRRLLQVKMCPRLDQLHKVFEFAESFQLSRLLFCQRARFATSQQLARSILCAARRAKLHDLLRRRAAGE